MLRSQLIVMMIFRTTTIETWLRFGSPACQREARRGPLSMSDGGDFASPSLFIDGFIHRFIPHGYGA